MEKKYELTDETKIIKTEECNIVLHRIRSLSNFNDVKKGDLGGWVESCALWKLLGLWRCMHLRWCYDSG